MYQFRNRPFSHDSRRSKNILILILVILFEIFDLFSSSSPAQRMSAHDKARIFVILELMLLEYRVNFIPEHSKIIYLLWMDIKHRLIFPCL